MRRVLLGVAALAVPALGACGGTTTEQQDGGQKDGGGDAIVNPDSGKPPPPDSGTPTTITNTYALHTVYLGEADRSSGTPSTTAWKAYGLNLDGLQTVKADTNVCTLQTGAPKTNQVDGNNGIDNSFGGVILPIFQAALSQPTPSVTETAAIDQGTWTVQLTITGLSDDPQQTAPGIVAQVYTSGQYDNGTPAFDSTTDWPVLTTSVKDGQNIASGSTMVFKDAFIENGAFVTQTAPDPLVLSLSFNGVPVELHLHDATIMFQHSSPTDLTNGTIAGVLDTEEFVTTLQSVAGQFSTTLCGAAFNGIAQQIRQASDIMNNGTNGAGQTCNGISVGIGFDAKRIANPTKVVAPPPPPTDPCQ
jgi:hypothetical protein